MFGHRHHDKRNKWADFRGGYSHLFLALLLVGTAATPAAFAIDEIVLLAGPWSENEGCTEDNAWGKMIELYRDAVLGVTPLTPAKVLPYWGGDTLRIELWSVGEAVQWGSELQADRVILSEWHCSGGKTTVSLQSVNTWEGTAEEPVSASGLLEAVRLLEAEHWIYGVRDPLPPPGFTPATPAGGERAFHDYLHTHDLYPDDAVAAAVPVRVKVKIIVNDKGVPVELGSVEIRPRGWEFETPVKKALWAMRFEPAMLNGVPVNSLFKGEMEASYIK